MKELVKTHKPAHQILLTDLSRGNIIAIQVNSTLLGKKKYVLTASPADTIDNAYFRFSNGQDTWTSNRDIHGILEEVLTDDRTKAYVFSSTQELADWLLAPTV